MNMKNTFYENVSKKHLEKLYEERDYYITQMDDKTLSDEHRQGCKLMAEFYNALILTARKHIDKHL